MAQVAKLGTRAVLSTGGLDNENCLGCGNGFAHKQLHVVANVYERGHWARVEHWHLACYERGGSPHGTTWRRKARRPRDCARAECEVRFIPDSRTRIYCSDDCSRLSKLERNRAWTLRRKESSK